MIIKKGKYCPKERITCPKCLEPVNIKLFSLNVSNGNNIEHKSYVISDFLRLSCEKCLLDFTFITCVYCNKKIFMKIHPKNVQYNGLDGYNIKCPYQSCGKTFYFSKCPNCQTEKKYEQSIKEGNIIICSNEKCKFQYIQVNCPIKYCTDLLSSGKPKFFTNFPIGIMLLHKNEIMYQKINCYYCCRPIVFPSTKNYKNKYCEAQKVECPYKDCKKSFNRIICPKCSEEIYINDGWYQMGSKIKCHKCNECFGKILCPACGKMNICYQKFFKSGHMKCGYNNCLKDINMINCLFCRKLNVLSQETQISGQVIKCGYCNNTFNEIFCPFCKKTNPFPLADFSFGKVYKCQYLTCMKEFQILICPKCQIHSFTTEKQEGQALKCEKCQTLYMNWGCPFCKSNIMDKGDKGTSLSWGRMIRCPSESCKKVYCFIRCSGCKKLIFSNENENFCGKAIKCPYLNCKAYTLITFCSLCNVKTVYSGKKTNLKEGEIIHCENCKKNYNFQRNDILYNGNLKVLEQINGKAIDFGVGEADENYLAIQELFFPVKNNNYPSIFISEPSSGNSLDKFTYKSKNRVLGECIVCHNNLKESVFFPCGHRCVCYNCAVILFAVSKKCPKCNQEASCIIKKIYE
jgi:hypothetical protein